MATSGTNPPPICKVKKITSPDPGTEKVAGCITVSSPWVYVVLSSNPENLSSATVSWDTVVVPVSVVEGNNLILRGATSDGDIASMVEVKFVGYEPTQEPASMGICIPTGC